ncbi:HlyD family type I secretion periplasmic adaptor subunit [Tardiphaga sp.]|uniref:HlyD family type I secretion periplasmic adaptor subunit n=1 Tax=Tardiphaga sp. TaxID=1926292 RepID=UPI00261DBB76|nr:HlyD family type I secretion periplasmic adaptor subunit [Tardiphaga sp.]MDB5617754.1 HlyD family type secretion periplasmic adaptor subunit [Tardiphaga sp.]
MKSAEAKVVPIKPKRSSDELAFLPAALEIVETPAPPLVGAVAAVLIALFCLALAWASLGKIDIVASAPGRVIPTGRVKTIQPFETGVVRAIRVRDGQTVKAGDVMIELDPTVTEAELKHLQNDLTVATLESARLATVLAEGDPLAAFRPPAGASASQVAIQRRYLVEQVEEQRAKQAGLELQKVKKDAELATATATISKLEAVLPILQQRVSIRQQLFDKEVGSKVNYLEILQAYTEAQQELAVQRSRVREAEIALAGIVESAAQSRAEFRRTLSTELVESQRKIAGLSEDVIKAAQRTVLQNLTAPVDGTVQQLAVHTVGGVVTPAQALLVIVPADSNLEIEAMISNRDIGFVHVGQEVAIKVDTFNFTRYGLLHGRVISVSQDAIARDRQQDGAGGDKNAKDDGSGQKSDQLSYAGRISLDSSTMQIDENIVNLSPGMAVTTEIKTGSRSVMSYLLSPLLRYKQESLRER